MKHIKDYRSIKLISDTGDINNEWRVEEWDLTLPDLEKGKAIVDNIIDFLTDTTQD